MPMIHCCGGWCGGMDLAADHGHQLGGPPTESADTLKRTRAPVGAPLGRGGRWELGVRS